MRVNIDEIKDRGLSKAWDLTREQIDEMVAGERAGYRADASARVESKLAKIERRVLLDGRVEARLTCPCGRCLVPMAVEVPVEFKLTLVPADEYSEPGKDAEEDQEGRRQGRSFSDRG